MRSYDAIGIGAGGAGGAKNPLMVPGGRDPVYLAEKGCPAFLYETPQGIFYGFSQIDDCGLKVSEHSGGQEVANPLTVNRNLEVGDLEPIEKFLQ